MESGCVSPGTHEFILMRGSGGQQGSIWLTLESTCNGKLPARASGGQEGGIENEDVDFSLARDVL